MNMQFTKTQIVMLAACGLLGLVLIYELFAPLGEIAVPTANAAKAHVSTVAPAVYVPPPAEAFAIIDDRSVFNPLRTRVASSDDIVDESNSGSGLPSDLTLIGVIIDPQTKMALLRSPASPTVISVKEGGTIDGWQVFHVLPDQVVFASDGKLQALKLSDNKPSASPPTQQSDPDQPSVDDTQQPADEQQSGDDNQTTDDQQPADNPQPEDGGSPQQADNGDSQPNR